MRNLLLGFIAGSVFGVAVAGGALVSAQFLDGFGLNQIEMQNAVQSAINSHEIMTSTGQFGGHLNDPEPFRNPC